MYEFVRYMIISCTYVFSKLELYQWQKFTHLYESKTHVLVCRVYVEVSTSIYNITKWCSQYFVCLSVGRNFSFHIQYIIAKSS